MRCFVILCAAFCGAVAIDSLALAQQFGQYQRPQAQGYNSSAARRAFQLQQQQQQMQNQARTINVKGTFITALNNGVQINSDTQQQVVIGVAPTSHVQVTGTAEADTVQTGALVRMRGEFDGKNTATAPIKEMQIVSMHPNLKLGAAPDDGTEFDKMDAIQAQAQPQQPPASTGPLTAAERAERLAARKAAAQANRAKKDPKTAAADAAPQKLVITGRVTKNLSGQLTVIAGNQNYYAALAPDADVKVNVAEYWLASSGDPVEATVVATADGRAIAHELKIKLSAPIKAMTKKPVAAKTPTARAAKEKPSGVGPASSLTK